MKDLVKIDGRRGEGGGQVLRTSLALSVITGRPLKIVNIRSRRRKSGLLRQHLTAVRAAVEISGARVKGDELGSTSLLFEPGQIRPGDYSFKIGSAGSTTLVLQTILPPLMLASGRSKLVIEGGTHNMMAPPYDFLKKSFVPLLNRQGVDVDLKLEKWGFYPAGGGQIEIEICPSRELKPFVFEERGKLIGRKCRSIASAISEVVCQRELEQVRRKLNWADGELSPELLEKPIGPGNVMLFELEYENVTGVFSSFGEKGVVAERVASSGISVVRNYLKSEAFACEYLADQLLIPLALAGEGAFTCMSLSSHTLTNMEVIKEFLDVEFDTEKLSSDCYRVSIK